MNDKVILVVDDEIDLLEMIQSIFERAGFFNILTASSGTEALKIWKERQPDMIILDIMMPGIDGLSVLREVRETSNIPVLLLTARGEAEDRVAGLEVGADDYLVKPFSFQELEARIKALLRRSGNESVHMALRCGDLVLDPPSHRAIRNGQVIDLTVKEYRLLEYFIQNQGTALSRMNLLKNVWDKDFDTNTNVVDVYVNYLRTKIDKDFEPKLIHTVVGVGYMMEA